MIVTLNTSTSPGHNKTQQTTALVVHLAVFRLTLQTERFKVDTQPPFCQSPPLLDFVCFCFSQVARSTCWSGSDGSEGDSGCEEDAASEHSARRTEAGAEVAEVESRKAIDADKECVAGVSRPPARTTSHNTASVVWFGVFNRWPTIKQP